MGQALRLRVSLVIGLSTLSLMAFQNCAPGSEVRVQDIESITQNALLSAEDGDLAEKLKYEIQQINNGNIVNPADVGFQCSVHRSGDTEYYRCMRTDGMPMAFGQSFALPPVMKFANQDLRFKFLSYGTMNADQQAFADPACTIPVDFPMGSNVYAQASNIVVPRCKGDDGHKQCMDTLDCQPMSSQVSGAGYVKNYRLGWTSAVLMYDLIVTISTVTPTPTPGPLPTPTPTATPTPTPKPTPTPVPTPTPILPPTPTPAPTPYPQPADPSITCISSGPDYLRCTKELPKVAGQVYAFPLTVSYGGKNLKIRFIYFGTSNEDQQAYSDANCTKPVNYYMGSGVYPALVNVGVVPRCKDTDGAGQCVDTTACQKLTPAIGAAAYVKNKALNWSAGYVMWDTVN